MKITISPKIQIEELKYCRQRLALHGLNFEIPQILGKSRVSRLNGIRALIAGILRDKNYSYVDIGAIMNRDHATAMHWVNNYEKKSNGRLSNFASIKYKLAQNNTKEELLLMIEDHFKAIDTLQKNLIRLEQEG